MIVLTGRQVLTFNNPFNVSTEKEIINIINSNSIEIKRTRILDGIANFNIDLPQNTHYFIQFPVAGDQVLITSTGTMEIELGQTITSASALKSDAIDNCTTCDNPLETSILTT